MKEYKKISVEFWLRMEDAFVFEVWGKTGC